MECICLDRYYVMTAILSYVTCHMSYWTLYPGHPSHDQDYQAAAAAIRIEAAVRSYHHFSFLQFIFLLPFIYISLASCYYSSSLVLFGYFFLPFLISHPFVGLLLAKACFSFFSCKNPLQSRICNFHFPKDSLPLPLNIRIPSLNIILNNVDQQAFPDGSQLFCSQLPTFFITFISYILMYDLFWWIQEVYSCQ